VPKTSVVSVFYLTRSEMPKPCHCLDIPVSLRLIHSVCATSEETTDIGTNPIGKLSAYSENNFGDARDTEETPELVQSRYWICSLGLTIRSANKLSCHLVKSRKARSAIARRRLRLSRTGSSSDGNKPNAILVG